LKCKVCGSGDLRARWYDPATGCFTTRDPFPGFAVLPQTLHPYVYVNNNPVNLTDPSGKFAFLPLLVVAVLGGIIGGVSYYTIQAIINADPCLGVQWHWQEALFWGGAGGVIGGLIGAAAYGGWQLGAKAIAWIRAISGGATTCATNESCRNTVLKGLEVFQRAAEFGINTYKDLRKLTEGTGLQVHHIIEQRFASLLKMNPDDMLSVVLTRGEHDKFTRLWQQAIGYSHWLSRNLRTDTASVEDIWKAAQEIYKDYPVLLEAAKKTLGIP
jgi:RHS repeat-associated protein